MQLQQRRQTHGREEGRDETGAAVGAGRGSGQARHVLGEGVFLRPQSSQWALHALPVPVPAPVCVCVCQCVVYSCSCCVFNILKHVCTCLNAQLRLAQ